MLIHKISRLLAAIFIRVSFPLIVASLLAFGLSSYLLMFFADEKEIIAADNFFYWLIVTASTVGYGDLSPSTAMGKLAASLWVIPVGLSLFALILTRVGFFLSSTLLRGKKGLRMLQIKNHCVIIGWNAARTLRLIELLLPSTNAHKERILLCVAVDIENPLPDIIDFVRVETFSHADTMARANLPEANRIIIDTPMDDVTLTTALYCDKICPNSHKTAYFQDESVGDLLRAHCPNIEIIPSVAVEMLARSSLDPGSALLHKQLLDTTYGMSQYCVFYAGQAPLKLEALFLHFKTKLSATVIGVKRQNDMHINLNPHLDFDINVGDGIYYISASRLIEKECFNF